jgi:hypothetical protein
MPISHLVRNVGSYPKGVAGLKVVGAALRLVHLTWLERPAGIEPAPQVQWPSESICGKDVPGEEEWVAGASERSVCQNV